LEQASILIRSTFICGRSSAMEEQLQLRRVRILNKDKIMLWIEREGEGKSRVMIKELGKKHKRGCKMSPQLISMPPLLKTIYIDRLEREENQEEDWSRRNTK